MSFKPFLSFTRYLPCCLLLLPFGSFAEDETADPPQIVVILGSQIVGADAGEPAEIAVEPAPDDRPLPEVVLLLGLDQTEPGGIRSNWMGETYGGSRRSYGIRHHWMGATYGGSRSSGIRHNWMGERY